MTPIYTSHYIYTYCTGDHFMCSLTAIGFYICCCFFIAENLSQAKEENLGMQQVLDQTLQELGSL